MRAIGSKRLFPVILVILFSFLFFPGCHKDKKEEKKLVSIKKESKLFPIEQIQIEAGDSTDKMYLKIYGEDAVRIEGDTLSLNIDRAYGRIKNMKKGESESYYQKTLKDAQKLEEERKLQAAAEKYRECAYIEREIFNKPGLALIALEKITDESVITAEDLLKHGDYKGAEPFAETAVYCCPSNAKALKIMGEILYRKGEENLSAPYLAASLKKEPDDPPIKYILKTVYMNKREPDKAIPLITEDISPYTKLLCHWPDLAEAYFLSYSKQTDNKDLAKKIDKALDKAMSNRRLTAKSKIDLRLAKNLFHWDFKEARKDLDELNKINTDPVIETRVFFDGGLVDLALGNTKKAIVNFKKAIAKANEKRLITQDENYMALMSLLLLDVMGSSRLTPAQADQIYGKFRSPDAAYSEKYGFIRDYLSARSMKEWNIAAESLMNIIKKDTLQPSGNFNHDILHIPAEKGIIYISAGQMYLKAGKPFESRDSYEKAEENPFLGYRAKECLKSPTNPNKN